MSVQPFVKGSLEPVVLHLLNERGELYGYEITKLVKEISIGKIALTEAALYPLLYQLEEKGMVSVRKATVAGRVRKYYKLTRKGVKQRELSVPGFVASLQSILTLLSPTSAR